MLNRIGGRAKASITIEGLGSLLKQRLLSVLCNLLSNFGAITCRRGPLDAQIAFLSFLQECDFSSIDIAKSTDIIIKIGE